MIYSLIWEYNFLHCHDLVVVCMCTVYSHLLCFQSPFLLFVLAHHIPITLECLVWCLLQPSASYCFLITAIDCGDPGTPSNGQHSLSNTTYNSVVTYTCDAGYTLQGSNSRTCQSSGQWNGSVPQCTCKLLDSSH